MPAPLLATSYDGFWLLILVLVAVVVALPAGIFAVVTRRRKLALGSGAVCLLFGAGMIAAGLADETDDARGTFLFAAPFILAGLLFVFFRRQPPPSSPNAR